MKKICKKLAFVLSFAVIVCSMPAISSALVRVGLNKTQVTIKVGKTTKLKITGTTDKVTWKSKNKKIATVTKGKVKGKKAGTTTIIAKVGDRKYTCKVTVKKKTTATATAKPKVTAVPTTSPAVTTTESAVTTSGPSITMPPSELIIDHSSGQVTVGNSFDVLMLQYKEANITWTCSNDIVSVTYLNESVKTSVCVTGNKAGTTVITFTDGYTSATCDVTVTDEYADLTYNADKTEVTGCTNSGTASVAKIPNGVTTINSSAFLGANITELIMGDTLTSIEDYAFYGCANLKSITWSPSLVSIGKYGFSNCNLDNTSLPSSVKTVGDSSFAYNPFESFSISNSMTDIPNSCFLDCSYLTEINIPSGVSVVGNSAFKNCIRLSKVVFGGEYTTMNNQVFSGCSSLSDVTLPGQINIIPDYVFMNCTSLTHIYIPDSVQSIEGLAFSGCTSLTTISGVADSYAQTWAIGCGYTFTVQ